jgi:hypothetical protein
MKWYFVTKIVLTSYCEKKLLEFEAVSREFANLLRSLHCNPVQGQYRARTGFPGDENRVFSVRNTTQGKPCFHYRDGFAV